CPQTALRAVSALALVLALAACGSSDGDSSLAEAPPPLGSAPPSTQNVTCKDYEGNPVTVGPKTVTIHNNSANSTIYPVLSTSQNAVNQWIQGCFRTTEPHPTKDVYK